jgi:hypothetical protein
MQNERDYDRLTRSAPENMNIMSSRALDSSSHGMWRVRLYGVNGDENSSPAGTVPVPISVNPPCSGGISKLQSQSSRPAAFPAAGNSQPPSSVTFTPSADRLMRKPSVLEVSFITTPCSFLR